jgi:hypothetical protein
MLSCYVACGKSWQNSVFAHGKTSLCLATPHYCGYSCRKCLAISGQWLVGKTKQEVLSKYPQWECMAHSALPWFRLKAEC